MLISRNSKSDQIDGTSNCLIALNEKVPMDAFKPWMEWKNHWLMRSLDLIWLRLQLDIFLLGFSEEDAHCGTLQPREHKIYLLLACGLGCRLKANMKRKHICKEALGFVQARETEQGGACQQATVKSFYSMFLFLIAGNHLI